MGQPVKKIDIKGLLKEEFTGEVASLGIERFRTGQILEWVYKRGVCDFEKMTNLSLGLRQRLKEKFYISDLNLIRQMDSGDGTKKFLFGLEDDNKVETVFIPSLKTNTVCVSSQVGCKFSCKFCASGKAGFTRNLRPAEMINQVLYIRGQFSNRDLRPYREVSPNVVFMGMGEPLDNYDNVLKAVRVLNAPYGLEIGQRKITISTCGLIPEIKRLAQEGLQIELSISLHSPNNMTRANLMSINKKYPLKDLMEVCKEYITKTNRQVTFEYVLIKGLNDSQKDAQDLARLLKGLLAKVNLILFNPVEGLDYVPPTRDAVKIFKDVLDKKGIVSTIRKPRGADIEAACGQLRLRYEV